MLGIPKNRTKHTSQIGESLHQPSNDDRIHGVQGALLVLTCTASSFWLNDE